MCGIVGYIGRQDAAPAIIEQLKKLEYRGYDSYGLATVVDRELRLYKAVGAVSKAVVPYGLLKSGIGIGHTRWATHGAITAINAHPHADCRNRYAVVHNGTIENFAELRDWLKGKGHHFVSDTDTEVIPHLLEEMTLQEALRKIKGLYALLVLDSATRTVTAACYQAPIMVTQTDDGGLWFSSSGIISGKRHVLGDGEILSFQDDGQRMPDCIWSHVDVDTIPSNNSMLQEIYEQPDTIARVAETPADDLRKTAIDILRSARVVFTASGTSRYASLIGRYIISQDTRNLGEVLAASEFPYFMSSITRLMTIVAVSQSGETADVLKGVREARHRGATVIGITNCPDSSLGRLCDRVLDTKCGGEYGVAATKTFTGQLAIFYLLRGAITNQIETTRQELRKVASILRAVAPQFEETARTIAVLAKDRSDFYYLARGINYAVAGESSLKLKEVSYIHAEGLSAGELKHGTLALIDDGTLVCGICPPDHTYQDMLLNLQEVKTRKGTIIGIAGKREAVFDYWIPLPSVPTQYYPMVSVVPAQMIAYWTAIEKGLRPERPRSLAKSVTVL